jgi:hypothetical protein
MLSYIITQFLNIWPKAAKSNTAPVSQRNMASRIRILLLSLSLYLGGNRIVSGTIYEPANITFTITRTYVRYTAIATIILNDNIIMSATIYTPSNHTVRATHIYSPNNEECTNFIESTLINDRRVQYYCNNAPLGPYLTRRLIVTIDVPDEATVEIICERRIKTYVWRALFWSSRCHSWRGYAKDQRWQRSIFLQQFTGRNTLRLGQGHSGTSRCPVSAGVFSTRRRRIRKELSFL